MLLFSLWEKFGLFTLVFAPKTTAKIFRNIGSTCPPPIQFDNFFSIAKIHNIFRYF